MGDVARRISYMYHFAATFVSGGPGPGGQIAVSGDVHDAIRGGLPDAEWRDLGPGGALGEYGPGILTPTLHV